MSPSNTTLEKKKNEQVLDAPKNAPLLVIVVDDLDECYKELAKFTDGLQFLPVNFRVLIRKGDSKKHKVPHSYEVKKGEVKKFFAFAHMALFFSENASKTLIKEAIEHDVVPLVHEEVNFLQNYSGPSEHGACFKFSALNSWSVYASLVRALENFGFPYDWKNIIKAAKNSL